MVFIKKKIFIDYDGVIVNTIKAIVSLYEDDFCAYKKYEPIDWENINTWNFEELKAATPDYINTYFNQPRFFRTVQFMKDAKYYIGRLSEEYDITVVSAGYSPNLVLKEKWIKEHLPYCKFVGVNYKEYSDKSHIDMSDGVFIDDSASNLITSNAKTRICFGKQYPWNEKWQGIRCNDWFEIYNILGGEK